MTAQTQARPITLIEAGKRAEAELAALRNLYDVALAESRAGRTTPGGVGGRGAGERGAAMTSMPICMGCGRSGVVTYGSLCDRCVAAEEREKEAGRG